MATRVLQEMTAACEVESEQESVGWCPCCFAGSDAAAASHEEICDECREHVESDHDEDEPVAPWHWDPGAPAARRDR